MGRGVTARTPAATCRLDAERLLHGDVTGLREFNRSA